MRITSIRYGVEDLARSAEDHASLGFAVERRAGSVVCNIGSTRVELYESDERASPLHCAWRIPAGAFAAAKVWLQQRRVILETNGNDEFLLDRIWHARSLYWIDCNGDVQELIEHPPEEAASTSFTASDIRAVDEVGIVVDDVESFVSAARVNLGVAGLTESGETFRPLGDAEGKLIVVKAGRSWFPTAHTAQRRRLEVELETGTVGEISLGSYGTIRSR